MTPVREVYPNFSIHGYKYYKYEYYAVINLVRSKDDSRIYYS